MNAPATASSLVDLRSIRRDGGTQIRAALSEDHVCELVEAINAGVSLPPVVAFGDRADTTGALWLADGFHRAEAWSRAGVDRVPVERRNGTRRDAVLYACGANTAHGLKRTNLDKRRAVEAMLRDEEWSRWSDREIARRAGVG
jgi:ParB-like chromosome segregation protein Spo0J